MDDFNQTLGIISFSPLFVSFGAADGFRAASLRFQAVHDTPWSRDLYFLTMVGWENRDKDAYSAVAGEMEFLLL